MKKMNFVFAILIGLALCHISCSGSEEFVKDDGFVLNEDLVGVWYIEYVDSINQDIIRRWEYVFTNDGKRELSLMALENGTNKLLGYQVWSQVAYSTKLDTISYGKGVGYTYNSESLPYPSKEDLLLGEKSEIGAVPDAETFKLIERGSKLEIVYLVCNDVADCPAGIMLNKKI